MEWRDAFVLDVKFEKYLFRQIHLVLELNFIFF